MNIPSLELKLSKRNSLKLESKNENNNNIIVNNYIDSPKPLIPLNSDRERSISPLKTFRYPTPAPTPEVNEKDFIEENIPMKTKSVEIIDKFKDLLIEYTTELLLNDMALISNISERGKNIIMKESHLVNIIKCLEPDVKVVEIEKEIVKINCSKCSFKNPLYCKINDITPDNRRSFSTSNFKVILQKTYNISLEYCI
jgi:hypothetical protein